MLLGLALSNTIRAPSDDESCCNDLNFNIVDESKAKCQFDLNDSIWEYTFDTFVCLDTMSFVRNFISYSKKNTDGTYGKWHRSKEQDLFSFTESCIRSKGESRKVNELFGNTPKNVVIDF